MPQGMSSAVIAAVFVFVVFNIVLFFVILKNYRKVPPNQAIIVSGAFVPGGSKVVLEGGTFVWPMIQQANHLTLELIPVELQTRPAASKDGAQISVTANLQVRVHRTAESVRLAASQFLLKGADGIQAAAQQTIEGHLYSALGTSLAKVDHVDTSAIASLTEETAAMDLAAMGLEIVSFTISEFRSS